MTSDEIRALRPGDRVHWNGRVDQGGTVLEVVDHGDTFAPLVVIRWMDESIPWHLLPKDYSRVARVPPASPFTRHTKE